MKVVVQVKKEDQRLWGHFKNFGIGGQKPSVTSLKHKHLVTWLLQTIFSEFPWKGYDCSMLPHLTVDILYIYSVCICIRVYVNVCMHAFFLIRNLARVLVLSSKIFLSCFLISKREMSMERGSYQLYSLFYTLFPVKVTI